MGHDLPGQVVIIKNAATKLRKLEKTEGKLQNTRKLYTKISRDFLKIDFRSKGYGLGWFLMYDMKLYRHLFIES